MKYNEKSNDIKQECEICGKLFSYKDMFFVQTTDGSIAVCNNCHIKIKKERNQK